jgi:hypothetical protein
MTVLRRDSSVADADRVQKVNRVPRAICTSAARFVGRDLVVVTASRRAGWISGLERLSGESDRPKFSSHLCSA